MNALAVQQTFGFALVPADSMLVVQGAQALAKLVIADIATLAPGTSTDTLEVPLDLPAGAIVTKATITVKAEPAGAVHIGDVASVRAAAGESSVPSTDLVIDFGGLRTVSAVLSTEEISSIRAWNGTSFAGSNLTSGDDDTLREFTEVRTERLLVTHARDVSPDDLASEGEVVITTPPADLQVEVAGARVDIRPGPASPTTVFDITRAVAAAIPPVQVVVRSSVPGRLEIEPDVDFLRTHAVEFAEGPIRVVSAAGEGAMTLILPLPDGSAGWRIAAIQVPVRLDVGAERVMPVPGPTVGADAELTMDPDRGLLVRLPPAHLARFARLVGVRVLVAAGSGGGELRGALRGDDHGRPGDALPGGSLGPVSIDPGADPGWLSLMAARPQAVKADTPIWVDLQVPRGTVTWPLAAAAPAANERAPIVRRLPNGHVRGLSSPAGVDTDNATIRVIGTAPQQSPLPALTVAALGSAPAEVYPGTDGAVVALGFDPPVQAPASTTTELAVDLVAYAAGSFTVGPVRIAYLES